MKNERAPDGLMLASDHIQQSRRSATIQKVNGRRQSTMSPRSTTTDLRVALCAVGFHRSVKKPEFVKLSACPAFDGVGSQGAGRLVTLSMDGSSLRIQRSV
jgi:hypothetical protein